MKIESAKIYRYIIFLAAFVVIVFIAFLGGSFLYDKLFGYQITAQFDELGPLSQSMPVYYKGYKIGKTIKIRPSDDYKYTNLSILLYASKLALPDNTIAKVEKFDSGKNYIELIYPQEPSEVAISKGSIIKGKTAVDIQSFMSAQADSGALSSISDNATKTLSSLKDTSDQIGAFFMLFSLVLEDSRQNIKQITTNSAKITSNLNETTKNTAEITSNLSQLSSKLNKSVKQDGLRASVLHIDKTTENLQDASANVKSITKNIDNATKNLDKTFSKLDDTVATTNDITSNVKGITCGFQALLNKRFAGMRILFGKPMNCNACPSRSKHSCCSKN